MPHTASVHRFATLAGRLVFGLAVIVLLAWAAPAAFLPGLRSWLTVMAGTGAIGLLFTSISLLLQCAKRGVTMARILAAVTVVIGVLNFVDVVWLKHVWFDGFLS